MLRGFSWVLVGVLWGSQVLAGNLQGFLWDDHGAFKTPARPLQKAPLIHPMSLPYATETVGYFLPKPSQNLHSLDQESCTLLKFTGPAMHPEVSTHLLNNFPGKISNLNKGYVVVCRMFLDVLGAMLASLVGGHHKKCHSADWQQQNT